LSGTSWGWLAGSLAVGGVVAGIVTRVIALRPVELILARFGLSSRPL
jgi:hypothetical protein